MKLKLRKKKKQNYLKVNWITKAPKETGRCCFYGPVVMAEPEDDMSDEEYEKRVDQVFELFGSHESH